MKKIFIFILILIIFYIIYVNIFDITTGNFVINKQKIKPCETSWKVNTCNYIVPVNIEVVFEENNIKKNNNTSKANIYLPCSYDNVANEINNMKLNENIINKVFIINNTDQLAAKDYLWKNIVAKYGLIEAVNLSPMTYILYENNDIKRLYQDYNENKIYILKKNIQRQQGLKISNKLDDIIYNKNEYTIAQELLQDPYLINGRKINLRIYVLVVCKKDNYEIYAYNNGFMYYTKELFKRNSLEFGPNITTGYIDRKVYDENPLTHTDFKKYLDDNIRELTSIEKTFRNSGIKLSDHIFNNIYELIKKVFSAFHGIIGNCEKLYNHLSFQLFGTDVAIDQNLNAKIMEVNKGPELGSKDKRDEALKKGLIKNILKIIDVIDNNNNDNNDKFIKLYSV